MEPAVPAGLAGLELRLGGGAGLHTPHLHTSQVSLRRQDQAGAPELRVPEQEVLRDSAGLSFDNFPSWVAFPDCDRAEWLNVVLKKVWPHLGPVSNTIAKRIIEPKISSVLKSLNVRSLDLEMLSNFKLREFVLGAEAARVGGVKARAANEPSAKFPQSRIRPLLGSPPGLNHLPALSHLRHY